MPREVWIAGGGITVMEGALHVQVLVLPPHPHVDGPRPAQVMRVGALDGEGALFEVVVVMRRQLGDVARTHLRRKIVHHQRRAPPDAAEAPRLVRHVEGVDADLETVVRRRPGLKRRHVRMRRRVGLGVRAPRVEVRRLRREQADDAAALRQLDAARPGRHDDERVAVRGLRLALSGRRKRRVPVGHDDDVLVRIVTLEDGARLRLAVGDDEVLAAGEPGLAVPILLLRRSLVEEAELGAGVGGGRRRRRGGGREGGAGI